jgi:CheY-like chemotaxis protein
VRVRVEDDGRGMAPEAMAHLFEPFFTTKRAGKGMGLGLATVYGIVRQNGGMVAVESAPGRGTTVAVHLPLHVAKEEAAPKAVTAKPSAPGHETILLVEDERAILGMVLHLLQRKGYTVLAADSPQAALDIAAAHQGRIDLLLTDVVMPGINGRELAERLSPDRPGMKKLFMSGHTADILAQQGVLGMGVHFIQKPFTIKVLSDKVREALEADG